MSASCNVHRAIDLIGSKWTILILHQLCSHNNRRGFNELLYSIEGINPRALSLRLKDLVERDLVTKTVYPTSPPQVEYSLTAAGASLKTIIEQLGDWADSLPQ